MRNNKTTFILLIIIFLSLRINNTYCAVYYISNEGNDSSLGTSEQSPWQTIDKLNLELSKLKAGDQVLFRCGDIFVGQINIPSSISGQKGSPIVFGSYGTGAKPVITGSIAVNNWVEASANVWKAQVSAASINQVFDGNRRLKVARTPNIGYFLIGGVTSSKNSFTDASIAMPNNYWKGTEIVYKLNEWLWVITTIDSSNTSGFVRFLPKDTVYGDLVAGTGYFIQNKRELVDTIDEWFFDADSKELYIFSATNPSAKNIRASVYDAGIKSGWPWTLKYVTIQDIELREHSVDEIQLFGANAFVVERCNIYRAGQYGIRINSDYVNYIRNSRISSNTIENSAMGGIFTWNVARSQITGNRIKNSGLYPVKGGALFWGSFGMDFFNGDSLVISHNKIDSSGYSGICLESHYSLVEKNIVDHSMLIASDGGAFYNNYGTYDTLRNNIFRNTLGNMEAAYPNAGRYTKEIYLDMDRHHYNTIENNTLISYPGNQNSGIGLSPTTTHTLIRNNVVYRSWRGINFSNFDAINKPINTIDVRKNIIYSNTEGGHPYWVNSWTPISGIFTFCDSNYLCNPFSDKIAEHLNVNNTSYYDFDTWKQLANADSHSTLSYHHWNLPTDSSFIIVNETDSFARYTFINVVTNLDNEPVTSIVLPPFSSKILIGEQSVKSTEYFISDTSITAIFEKKKYHISIYPNPVNNNFFINLDYNSNQPDVELMDLLGRELGRFKFYSNQLTLNMQQYKPGIYFIRIGNTINKILVQH
jgi:hypothetical protein